MQSEYPVSRQITEIRLRMRFFRPSFCRKYSRTGFTLNVSAGISSRLHTAGSPRIRLMIHSDPNRPQRPANLRLMYI